jgi:transketolase
MNNAKNLESIAKRARVHVLNMVYNAQASHIGSAYSIIDILTVLYFRVLSEDDRFILSKGHAAAGLYAILVESGILEEEELRTFCNDGSRLTGHVSHEIPGVEISSGSLGHGLSIGCGLALARKMDGAPGNVYVLVGDGEQNEGSVWEAALFARQHELNNLVAIIDSNSWQGLGRVADILGPNNSVEKWQSFGWRCVEIDGHDFTAIEDAVKPKSDVALPTLVFAHTVKGKGVDFMEDTLLWHYRSPRGEEYDRALQELTVESP